MLEINNTTQQKINLKKTQKIVASLARVYKKTGQEISVALVADAKMKSLNEQYRGQAKTTDVLSFSGEKSAKFLGEIVINIQEARRAGKYQEMFRELGLNPKRLPVDYIFYFLLVHGFLHLCGYNDEKTAERQEMLSRGKEFLDKLK